MVKNNTKRKHCGKLLILKGQTLRRSRHTKSEPVSFKLYYVTVMLNQLFFLISGIFLALSFVLNQLFRG